MHLNIPDVATLHPPPHRQCDTGSRQAQKQPKMHLTGHSQFLCGVGPNHTVNATNRKLNVKLQINLPKHYGAPKVTGNIIQDSTGHTVA